MTDENKLLKNFLKQNNITISNDDPIFILLTFLEHINNNNFKNYSEKFSYIENEKIENQLTKIETLFDEIYVKIKKELQTIINNSIIETSQSVVKNTNKDIYEVQKLWNKLNINLNHFKWFTFLNLVSSLFCIICVITLIFLK